MFNDRSHGTFRFTRDFQAGYPSSIWNCTGNTPLHLLIIILSEANKVTSSIRKLSSAFVVAWNTQNLLLAALQLKFAEGQSYVTTYLCALRNCVALYSISTLCIPFLSCLQFFNFLLSFFARNAPSASSYSVTKVLVRFMSCLAVVIITHLL